MTPNDLGELWLEIYGERKLVSIWLRTQTLLESGRLTKERYRVFLKAVLKRCGDARDYPFFDGLDIPSEYLITADEVSAAKDVGAKELGEMIDLYVIEQSPKLYDEPSGCCVDLRRLTPEARARRA